MCPWGTRGYPRRAPRSRRRSDHENVICKRLEVVENKVRVRLVGDSIPILVSNTDIGLLLEGFDDGETVTEGDDTTATKILNRRSHAAVVEATVVDGKLHVSHRHTLEESLNLG